MSLVCESAQQNSLPACSRTSLDCSANAADKAQLISREWEFGEMSVNSVKVRASNLLGLPALCGTISGGGWLNV